MLYTILARLIIVMPAAQPHRKWWQKQLVPVPDAMEEVLFWKHTSDPDEIEGDKTILNPGQFGEYEGLKTVIAGNMDGMLMHVPVEAERQIDEGNVIIITDPIYTYLDGSPNDDFGNWSKLLQSTGFTCEARTPLRIH